MNDYKIVKHFQEHLYNTYPFLQWEFDFKKDSRGTKFTFTATNLVTNTTLSVATLCIFIEDYQIEYVEQNIKSLVEKIKAESTKQLLSGMEN